MKVISATGMNDFMMCPTLYDLSRTWEVKIKKPAFSLGSIVHAMVQGWHCGEVEPEQMQSVAWEFRDKLEAEYREFTKTNPEFPLAQRIEELRSDMNLAASMAMNYAAYWDMKFPVSQKQVEVPFLHHLGRGLWFRGFMDMVVPMEDHVQVIEIKTTVAEVGSFAMSDLHTNQSIGYVIAAERIYKKPAVIVYDVLRKAVPSDIEPLSCKKTKHDATCCNGSMISGMSKTRKTVLRPTALQWLAERPWIDPSSYVHYLEGLDENMRRYFHRKTVDVPMTEREAWLENTREIARRAHRESEKKSRYKCWTACSTRYGQCKFYGYCRSQDEMYLENHFKRRGVQ